MTVDKMNVLKTTTLPEWDAAEDGKAVMLGAATVELPSSSNGPAKFATVEGGVEAAGRAFFRSAEQVAVKDESHLKELLQAHQATLTVASTSGAGGKMTDAEKKRAAARDEANAKKSKNKAGTLKLGEELEGLDFYKVLDLPATWAEQSPVNLKELENKFKKACVTYHPDKKRTKQVRNKKTGKKEQVEVGEEEKNKFFVAIQSMFDILKDPVKRRKYESSLPFDDSVPSEDSDLKEDLVALYDSGADSRTQGCKEWHELFFPVFARNGKFSSKKQAAPALPEVPAEVAKFDLASAKKLFAEKKLTPPGGKQFEELTNEEIEFEFLEKVHMPARKAFYDYWTTFESWRDFDVQIAKDAKDTGDSDLELDDTDKADDRWQKRRMEAKNARIRAKYSQKEFQRVLNLTELAEKYDFAMRRCKELNLLKKNAGKRKKQAAAEAAAAEAAAAADAAAKAEEEAAALKLSAKARKEAEQKEIKTLRREIRDFLQLPGFLYLDSAQFQDFVLALGKDVTELKRVKGVMAELKEEGADCPAAPGSAMTSVEKSIFASVEKELEGKGLSMSALSERRAPEEKPAPGQGPKETAPSASNETAKEEAAGKKGNKKGKKNANANPNSAAAMIDEYEGQDMNANKAGAHKGHNQGHSNEAAEKKKKLEQQKKKEQQQKEEAAAKKEAQKAEKAAKKAEEDKQKKAEQDRQRQENAKKLQQQQSALAQETKSKAEKSDRYALVRTEQKAAWEKIPGSDPESFDGKAVHASIMEKISGAGHELIIPAIERALDTTASGADENKGIDRAAVILADLGGLSFFEIAKNPDQDLYSPEKLDQDSSQKNKLKKLRTKMRKFVKDHFSAAGAGANRDSSKDAAMEKASPMLKTLFNDGAFPPEEWQMPPRKQEKFAPAARATGEEATEAKKPKKKKAKKAAAPVDDDFAALEEFAAENTAASGPGKKKKGARGQ